jgi:hypothetical protein
MSQATLNLVLVPKRMLTKAEAAAHCGRSIKRFAIECPVRPIQFANGDLRYDVRDLDNWLDSLKAGHDDNDVDLILEKLV